MMVKFLNGGIFGGLCIKVLWRGCDRYEEIAKYAWMRDMHW